MRRSLLIPTAVLAGALVVGCDDQQPPTASSDPPTPSLGAERIRPVFGVVLMGADPSTSLVLQTGWEAGITAEDLCADFTGAIEETGQKGQIVFTPPGGVHIQTSGRDANIVVYQYGGGIVTDICTQLVGAPIVGTGTGHFTFLIQDAGPGATVFHVNVRGTIDLATGGQARVFGVARVTILPDGTQLFDEERIRLTPL
jgi:hypothetical protein